MIIKIPIEIKHNTEVEFRLCKLLIKFRVRIFLRVDDVKYKTFQVHNFLFLNFTLALTQL